eukprot:GFYU01000914.1.p1 GENE.GFYU01000914.1~~GFYU01000914.1.p1  ORF type:complete len:163 (-),score=57.11 GFYU01000914.1:63-551(-)
MPASFGIRARTRDLFSKGFRKHGMPSVGRYLRTFHVGDYVDVVCDPSIHKGMPFKFYHGKTGVIFNVNKRAVGVVVNKEVNGRWIPKKIHVRIEHVQFSRSREDFLNRVKANDKIKHEAKERGEKVPSTKRIATGQPKDGFFVSTKKNPCQVAAPLPFELTY